MTKRERIYHYGSKGLYGLLRCKGVYQPTGSSTITIEDIREWAKQLEEANIKSRYPYPMVNVTSINDTHYQLSGSVHGTVLKEKWDNLIKERLKIIL